MSCSIPLITTPSFSVWVWPTEAAAQTWWAEETERQKEGESERQGEGQWRTETEIIGFFLFLLPGWFLLSNPHSCCSSQLFGSTRFPILNCMLGGQVIKASSICWCQQASPFLDGSFPPVSVSVNRPYIKLSLDFLSIFGMSCWLVQLLFQNLL